MKKEIYIEEAKDHLAHAKKLKERKEFTFNLKMHIMSKLDGICSIGTRDRDLSPKDYKEICDAYFEINAELMAIVSDAEPEEEM